MATVSTMILRSMRMIGEKERGDTLDAAEQVECLAELNTFMESWSIDRLNIYTIKEDVHTLTASTSTYTIGPNGAINTQRPVRIVDATYIRDSSGYDTPVEIITLDMYRKIVDKDAGYTVPTYLYYDTGYSSTSTGRIYLYPNPGGALGLELHIHSWQQLQSFVSLSTIVLLPPGYQLAIESNFAVHLAAGFRPISGELAKIAQDSKKAIQDLNLPSPVMQMDTGNVFSPYGNILTGTAP